jgi:hypothetical protein
MRIETSRKSVVRIENAGLDQTSEPLFNGARPLISYTFD